MIYKFNHETIFINYLRHIKICGSSNIIEIYESKFGKRKYNKGHRVDDVWVFGCVERNTRIMLLVPVLRRTKKSYLISSSNMFIHILLSILTAGRPI
jgi:hypothetical protein